MVRVTGMMSTPARRKGGWENFKNKPLINYIVEDDKFKDDFLGNLSGRASIDRSFQKVLRKLLSDNSLREARALRH